MLFADLELFDWVVGEAVTGGTEGDDVAGAAEGDDVAGAMGLPVGDDVTGALEGDELGAIGLPVPCNCSTEASSEVRNEGSGQYV